MLDASGVAVLAQLEPNDLTVCESCNKIPPVYSDVVFFRARVPAFGLATYRFAFDPSGKDSPTTAKPAVVLNAPPAVIHNGVLNVSLDAKHGGIAFGLTPLVAVIESAELLTATGRARHCDLPSASAVAVSDHWE